MIVLINLDRGHFSFRSIPESLQPPR